MSEAQTYAMGLIVEEMAEAAMMVGKALRFGIDAPGPATAPYHGCNARQLLEIELGDVMAAIDYACACGLVDAENVATRAQLKTKKLLDPASIDSNGRRLAPAPQ